MKSNDIIMTFSLLCKNKVVEKPLDHKKNHELEENRMILTPNTGKASIESHLEPIECLLKPSRFLIRTIKAS